MFFVFRLSCSALNLWQDIPVNRIYVLSVSSFVSLCNKRIKWYFKNIDMQTPFPCQDDERQTHWFVNENVKQRDNFSTCLHEQSLFLCSPDTGKVSAQRPMWSSSHWFANDFNLDPKWTPFLEVTGNLAFLLSSGALLWWIMYGASVMWTFVHWGPSWGCSVSF